MATTNVKKQVQAIKRQQQKLNEMNEKLKTKCTHTVKGDLDIVPDRKFKEGSLHFICRQCEKELNLTKLAEDELKNACSVIDRAIDTIKLQLDPNREDDLLILKKMARTQYRVRGPVQKYYAAALKKNSRGRRGNRRRGNQDNGLWSAPSIH